MKRCAASLLLLLLYALLVVSLSRVDALNLKLKGVNYDFRRGPDGDPTRCKVPAKINKELSALASITPRIRIYSVSDCNVRPILKYARLYNLSVWMGVWVGNTTNIFENELKTLTKLVSEGAIDTELVVCVNVGSEALYRNDTTPEQLIANMQSVKELFKANSLESIPITITDTLDSLLSHPEVVDAVDIVSLNAFPFWSKIPVEDAAANLNESIAPLAKIVGRKEIVITETGWATDGSDHRASKASPESAARYLNDFFLLAEQNQWMYYYFSGFDTPYRKQMENNVNTVEAYFGIFSVGANMIKAYEQLVINGTDGEDGPTTNITTKVIATVPSPSPASASAVLMTANALCVAITTSLTLLIAMLDDLF
uniref:glucan endo-1,3-beta-D-glucosidase n=1 Tax=Globisporangium ultimum (strain ATCC 200006 / CBS 805.95 / DAOM BR144) TaxID=431595 RepID=K3XBI5_GLOUD